MILRVLFTVITLLVLVACGEVPYTNINNTELKLLQDEGIPVFDIRRPDEWNKTGVIEGSKLLTFVDSSGRVIPDFFEHFTNEINRDDPVILICRTGNRTGTISNFLDKKLSYTKVYNVRKGITDWIKKGNPTVKPVM